MSRERNSTSQTSDAPLDLRESEEKLQCRIIKWWDMVCARYGCEPSDLFHIPNGLLGDGVRKRCLTLGLRPGYPDLMLVVPRGIYHAFCLELKRPGNKNPRALLRNDQVRILKRLSDLGYAVMVSNDFDLITSHICRYLELKK